MILLTQLILVHLIGDFLLQPDRWKKQKEALKWRAPALYYHILTHLILLSGLILIAAPALWHIIPVITATHLLIDGIKLQNQTDQTKINWFFADQAMHFLVIVAVWIWIAQPGDLVSESLPAYVWQPDYWIILTAAFFLTTPASSMIRHLMLRWTGEIEEAQIGSLKDAGTYIGILERLFIFISILSGFWQTVGFLLAAKSVFRFGDLTRARDRKLTEYIMVGTLLSFSMAMAVALLIS